MQDLNQPSKILITHPKMLINISIKKHVFYPPEKAIPQNKKEFQILSLHRSKEKLMYYLYKTTINSLKAQHINKDPISN